MKTVNGPRFCRGHDREPVKDNKVPYLSDQLICFLISNSSSYQTERWRCSVDPSTVHQVPCSSHSDAAWCPRNTLYHYQRNPGDRYTCGTEGQVMLLQFKTYRSEEEESSGDWLDSSQAHGRTVGVLVTGTWSTDVLQAAAAVWQVVEARKTLTVRLKQTDSFIMTANPPQVLILIFSLNLFWSWSGGTWFLSVFHYLPWSFVDASRGLSGAASFSGLTRIDGHADSSIAAVTLITGAQVLVWTRVDAGGVGVTDLLKTRVYCWGHRQISKYEYQ